MAGDWIKWCKGLHRKKEVIGIAKRLGIVPAHAAGLCMVFWEWLDDNVSEKEIDKDGDAHMNLGALDPEFIDRLVGADGFAAALAAEGWLNIRFGSLTVPNFTRHNQTGKTRAVVADRVSRYRQRHSQKPCNGSVTLQALHTINNDDDVVVEKTGKGGSGERGPPGPSRDVTPEALQPDPSAVQKKFHEYARIWGPRGPLTKRDRVLLWRVCYLATDQVEWAKAALESLSQARPNNPGAYLQKLVLELGPREPNVGVILAGIAVPAEVERPPTPPHRVDDRPVDEKPLSPEEARSMMAELMAVVRRPP